DEPTKGFDPVNRRLLMSIIAERKQAGATIMMVTHQMEDAEKLCDRVILLKDGAAHAYGTVEAVQDQFGGTTVRLEADRALPGSKSYEILSEDHGHAEIALAKGVAASEVLNELVGKGVSLSSFTPGKRSLESIFVSVYGDAGREDNELARYPEAKETVDARSAEHGDAGREENELARYPEAKETVDAHSAEHGESEHGGGVTK
ncbi:MAG: DUF4162 domain-containing protein, partial [Propionibacteriaceae bacterium]|nr:DUF4162 domain-containing protein [Propionibacteriaceae bacterium]